jgi:riboflavin biosynthesis pyrimidine reductase
LYGTECASHANVDSFLTYCEHKEKAAAAARLSGFYTVRRAPADSPVLAIGNEWSRRLFDGDFYRSEAAGSALPVVSLVFVQSKDGNTVAADPSTLGGGESDKHLVYEGLSRIDADAVMAGAATARSERMVFSVWHPELVALRLERGHPRHPAQIVITHRGDLPIERGLMFNEPSLRVFLITRSGMVGELRKRLGDRQWVEVIDAGEPVSLTNAMQQLWQRGLRVISCVGGRRTATAMIREGLIRDLYLTTSPIEAGEPNTPFYEGPPLTLTQVIERAGRGDEEGVRFEHLLVASNTVTSVPSRGL